METDGPSPTSHAELYSLNGQGCGPFPSIILSGRTKVFHYSTSFGPEHKEFFDFLWSQAAHALKRPDRLVLSGYSLLPVDERACDLLLKVPSFAEGFPF